LRIFARALFLLAARQQYPEVLVLEYGIDRVGEMDDLLAVAKPNIAILTSIGLSHYQFFQDQKTIEQEKK
jgi:UDP-N-acetylmuramoyl-tripeptide--D-alanyl-D-alanine ligase